MSAPSSHHATSLQLSARGTNPAEERRAMERGLPMALVTWPLFAALDAFVVLAVFPSVPLTRLLCYRLIGEGILLWLYLLARRERTSAALLDVAHVCAVWSTGGLISVMALEFGDLTWNYMHGLSLVMLIDATMLPTHFVRSLRMTIPVALSFPAIMGIGAMFDGRLATQWTSPRTLVVFGCNYIFVLATAILVSVASHGLWSARRQVYQARKLGRYRLVAPIGRGGQNEVWLAWDESLRRNVALKLLRSESKSEADVRSFEREARATSRLTSPHTVRIFDFGASSDGIFYIAMEHLMGADLATLVRDHGPMPAGRVIHFARQVCISLAEAHDAGLIHRDIKPHNLYATRIGDDHDVLKVLDFGIAKEASLEDDNVSMTDVGVIKGTPTYMSPEMITGGVVDSRTDLYSLGVTLYYLLTGAVPFEGRSWGKLVYSHLTTPPVPPSLRTREPLSEELEQIVLRCLEKKSGDRFQSARELLAVLDACAATQPWTSEDAKGFWKVRATLPRVEPPPDPGPTVRLRPDKSVSAA